MGDMSSPRRDAGPRSHDRTAGKRPRASHSLESVLAEAVAILDESGAQGLTIRVLAARLGGGPASVYWYVSGRDELLDLAADSVLAGVLEAVRDVASDNPIADLRTIARTLFDAIVDRPWLGAYAMRDTGRQLHSLQLYERIGEEVMRLGLTPQQCFYAASAVVGFVIGTAADMGQELPDAVTSGELDQKQYLAEATRQWRALDPAAYPFIHHIVDEFAVHEDRDQFRAGLDLLLAGLELQARRAVRPSG